MRRGNTSQNLQTVTWLIWHIGLKVTGRRPFSSILKSSWCIVSAQNYYPKSIHKLLLALKSYEYQWHNAASLCRKGREKVCWAFVLCWIFGLRAKPLDLKLPPPSIPPHYKVVAGSKWAAFFVIGPLLRVIAIEHPCWDSISSSFLLLLLHCYHDLKDGEEPLL